MSEFPTTEHDAQAHATVKLNDLIWFELKGKNVALARYDSIIWKIRSGYLVILYGALSLLLSRGGDPHLPLESAMVLLIWGFSAFVFLVDCTFRIRQLHVVIALNELMKWAIARTGEAADRKIQDLLLVAGESTVSSLDAATRPLTILKRALFPSALIYVGTPLLSTLYLLYF